MGLVDGASGDRRQRSGDGTPRERGHPLSGKVLVDLAMKEGWVGDELPVIPELLPVFEKPVEMCLDIIRWDFEDNGKISFALVRRAMDLLFTKGAEATMLWGFSERGVISLWFEPGDILNDWITTDVAGHLHDLVVNAARVGDTIFMPWQIWLAGTDEVPDRYEDIMREVEDGLTWMPRLGVAYGLARGYHELGPEAAAMPRRYDYERCAETAAEKGEEAGLAELARVLEREQDNGLACSMGNYFWSHGFYRLALAAHERSLAIKVDPATLFNKAVCLADLGDMDAAVAVLKDYLARIPAEEAEWALQLLRDNGKGELADAAET